MVDEMTPVSRMDWVALTVRRLRAPNPVQLDYKAGGPGWDVDPAHLLKDLRRMREQELAVTTAERERSAITAAQINNEMARAVAEWTLPGDQPVVALSRPWSTWLTLPKNLDQLTDWARLRWLYKRGIAIPKDILVYNATPKEWESDDPPPNSKYLRRLTEREKSKIRTMMVEWLAPRTKRCAKVGDHYDSLRRRKNLTWGVAGTGGWDTNDLVFSVAKGPRSPDESLEEVMAQAAAKRVPIQEIEWKSLQQLLPELSDEDALKECEKSKGMIRAHHALEDWTDRQAQSREHRLLLKARQRLSMTIALNGFFEYSTRRYLKLWGYLVFPGSRVAWKGRATVMREAFAALYPQIAFAHHSMDPMDLDSRLCKTGYTEADQTALTEAIKTCEVGRVKRLLMNPDVRVHGVVPRHKFSYLHLAVLAARHVFDSDCEFWFSRPACLEIIDIVARRGFQNNMDVGDEGAVKGVKGVTPLQYAAFLWDEEIFRFLIKKGAKRDVCSGVGSQSVYHYAVHASAGVCGAVPECVKCWGEEVLKLMELREPTDWPLNDSQVPDGLSFTRFVACLSDPQEPWNKRLINQGTFGNRRSPFFVACAEHHLQLAKVLLEHGADPCGYAVAAPIDDDDVKPKPAQSVEEATRLESPCAAALKYNWDTDTDGRKVVNYLIDNNIAKAGEGLRNGTASGWPFFLVALAQGMETLGMDDEQMPPGCIMHNERLLESLLERKADINEVIRHHPIGSPYTCAEGVSAFLLACGQCARIRNPDANFAFEPDVSLIEWLLDRNVKTTVTNRYGQSGLWVASRAACFECHCASQRHPDCVCGKGKDAAKLVQYLVTHGAVVDQPDVNGTTPLHCACIFGQVAIVRTLLTEGGADPNIPDYFGCFPRDSARMRGYHSIVELIDKVHPPTRVQYMGSMARSDPEVAKVAGSFLDSGIVSLTHGDYTKASVSFKVALAKIQDKDVLASSAPDLCWMLAYIQFFFENRKRALERQDESSENQHEIHRWLHGRMIKQLQRAPIIEYFEKALRFQKTHLLTNQSLDIFRCKEKCGADDDELLKMILCNAPLHKLRTHLQMKATPESFKALYGRALPTPLYLSIQYSTPEVFELLLQTTGDWILGGPRPDGKPAGPGGKLLDPTPECPHYLYPWGAACGDKERSVVMHELHQWLPTRTPQQACEWKLTHGWCPVTAGFESVQMRKTCMDILKTYIRAREKTQPGIGAATQPVDGKKKRKSGASKKKKKNKAGDDSHDAQLVKDNSAEGQALQQSKRMREERMASLNEEAEDDDDLEEMVPPSSTAPIADDCDGSVDEDDEDDDDDDDHGGAGSDGHGDRANVELEGGRKISYRNQFAEVSAVPDSVRAALARAGVSALIPTIEEADSESETVSPMSATATLQNETQATPVEGPSASHSLTPGSSQATHIELQSRFQECQDELVAKAAEAEQLRRSLEEERLRFEQELQAERVSLQNSLAELEKKAAQADALAEAQRSAQLRERLLVHHLVTMKRALIKTGAQASEMIYAGAKENDNGEGGVTTAAPPPGPPVKLTAAQRRQAKARQADAAEAREDVEYLVRKHGNAGHLLPISRLPTLYAEEYGRHRPLSLPSWEESLAQLETCHLITAAEAVGCKVSASAPAVAAPGVHAAAGAARTAAAVPAGQWVDAVDPKEGFVVWCGPEQ